MQRPNGQQQRLSSWAINYISIIIAHIQEFAAGWVSWARGVNQWYDLTEEEWAAEMGLGELVIVS